MIKKNETVYTQEKLKKAEDRVMALRTEDCRKRHMILISEEKGWK